MELVKKMRQLVKLVFITNWIAILFLSLFSVLFYIYMIVNFPYKWVAFLGIMGIMVTILLVFLLYFVNYKFLSYLLYKDKELLKFFNNEKEFIKNDKKK